MRKLFLLLLTLALLAVGGWLFLSSKTPGDGEAAPNRKYVVTAEQRNIDFNVEVSGDITPAVQIEIKPEVGGKIKKLYVDAGGEVKVGDPLVDIDDTDLLTEKAGAQTEIEGAQLELNKTQRNFDRSSDLFSNKLISREVFDNLDSDLAIAKNNLVKAQRKLQTVEDRLRKIRITAPTDGTVLSVPVSEGQVVNAAASVNSGTTLMTLADLSRLLVDTHVNQIDVGKLSLGQTVTLKGETIKDRPITAKVSFIAPIASIKNNVKGFQVEAVIDDPDPRLRPGMTVLMDIPVAQVDNAVAVPISAVFKDPASNNSIVYVLNGSQTSERQVEVGVSNLQFAEIKSGLEVGESILLVRPGSLRKQS